MLKIKHTGQVLIILFTVALTLVGCNRNTIYSHYESTPLEGWEINNQMLFEVGPIGLSGDYETSLGLRTTTDYPYMGLTLIVEQTVWPSNWKSRDTVSVELVDRNGEFLGKGVSTFQYVSPISVLHLDEGDSLKVTVRHYMAQKTLPGILDVGLVVNRR
jgi:gliding motility-associated lipoprotein GldH